MGPREIERLSVGRMEIPLSGGIDGTMFEKFSWSRERYCEKRLIILSSGCPERVCGRSSSSSLCLRFCLVVGTCCWPIAAISCSLSCWNFVAVSLGIIWPCGCSGIKWMLVTIYDRRFHRGILSCENAGGTKGRRDFSLFRYM